MKQLEEDFMASLFTADAVYSFIKNGNYPTQEVAYQLDRKPLIDNMRKLVVDYDIDWIIELSESPSDWTAGFAISLLRHYGTRKEVKECLQSRWEIASSYLKNRIMWRLLDIPELSMEWHIRFLNFIIQKWEAFNEFNQTFFGSYPKSVIHLLSRIGDQSFPGSKRWIYFCCVPGIIRDKYAAAAVLEAGKSHSDAFTQVVVKAIDNRISNVGNPPQVTGNIEKKICPNEKQLVDFLSEAIIRHFREDKWRQNIPSESDSDLLNRLPIIDFLRNKIQEKEIPYILNNLETQEGETAGLYLSFLKKFTQTHISVKEWLKQCWERASASLKAHLMWRILDDPDLPEEWHRKIFTFVQDQWETFNRVSSKFLGTPHTIISQVLKRIGDPNFPQSKRWAYLCRFPDAVEDKAVARALMSIAKHMEDNTPFTQEVAETLWAKFFKEQ